MPIDLSQVFFSSHCADSIDRHLQVSMQLYNYLQGDQQRVICDFVQNFYDGKRVYCHPNLASLDEMLLVTAANAALVGAAQQTNFFSCLKWIYFCADDLDVDGDAYMSSTVRLHAETCLVESRRIHPGRNVIVHEFSHILDSLLGISGSTRALRTGYDDFLNGLRPEADAVLSDFFTPAQLLEGVEAELEQDFHYSELEFFAAASEAFFTDAARLKRDYPELYRDLSAIYGLDLAGLNWAALHHR